VPSLDGARAADSSDRTRDEQLVVIIIGGAKLPAFVRRFIIGGELYSAGVCWLPDPALASLADNGPHSLASNPHSVSLRADDPRRGKPKSL